MIKGVSTIPHFDTLSIEAEADITGLFSSTKTYFAYSSHSEISIENV